MTLASLYRRSDTQTLSSRMTSASIAMSKRRVGKSAKRRAHVGVNANCESDVGMLRFAHPTLADCGLRWQLL